MGLFQRFSMLYPNTIKSPFSFLQLMASLSEHVTFTLKIPNYFLNDNGAANKYCCIFHGFLLEFFYLFISTKKTENLRLWRKRAASSLRSA